MAQQNVYNRKQGTPLSETGAHNSACKPGAREWVGGNGYFQDGRSKLRAGVASPQKYVEKKWMDTWVDTWMYRWTNG